MNKKETIAYLKGKLQGLRGRRKELMLFKKRIEEDISIAKDELKQWEDKQ